LGTCFGAIHEPPQSPNYISVFTDPATSNIYTPYDLNAQHIRLSRSMIHYRNFSYPLDSYEGADMDAHPSIVDQWYNQPSKKENTFLDYKIIDFDGSVIEKGSYKYSEIPSRIMELSPALFTAEEIAHRRLSEQEGAATVQLTTGHSPPPNAPTHHPPAPQPLAALQYLRITHPHPRPPTTPPPVFEGRGLFL
jgi:hypothetical protein